VFFALLVLTLSVSLLTSGAIILLFRKPIRQILDRVIGEEIASGWHRFLLFAVFVVGVSSGVQIWKLEQYAHPERMGPAGPALTLDAASVALEIYRTMIQTLQGVAWALLVFFIAALVAFAIIQRGERKSTGPGRPG
jgi:hypothetical protein